MASYQLRQQPAGMQRHQYPSIEEYTVDHSGIPNMS